MKTARRRQAGCDRTEAYPLFARSFVCLLGWYSLALLGKRGATGDDGESTRATERVLLAVRPLESLCAAALPTGTEVWKVGAADANMMV